MSFDIWIVRFFSNRYMTLHQKDFFNHLKMNSRMQLRKFSNQGLVFITHALTHLNFQKLADRWKTYLCCTCVIYIFNQFSNPALDFLSGSFPHSSGFLVGIFSNPTRILQDHGRLSRTSRRQKCKKSNLSHSGSNHRPPMPSPITVLCLLWYCEFQID